MIEKRYKLEILDYYIEGASAKGILEDGFLDDSVSREDVEEVLGEFVDILRSYIESVP